MAASDEKRDGLRLLGGLENGGLSAGDAANVAERIDPVLVYVIVSYLRAAYPASDPAASGVLERVVKFTSSRPSVVKKHREGRDDPISRWFEKEHDYRSFRGRGSDLVDLIVDKLES